jgi:hypothetical protein
MFPTWLASALIALALALACFGVPWFNAQVKPGSTDQPLLLSRESAVAADGLVGCRSTGVGA